MRRGLPLPGQGEVGLRKGMSVTILDPSLKVKGYLTQRDKEYVEAARSNGIHTYMLSFVEQKKDIDDLLALDKEAQIVAKIESKKGMDFVSTVYPRYRSLLSGSENRVTLMAARGDLYLQLDMPHQIIEACKDIAAADSHAIMASRLLGSVEDPDKVPRCHDLTDITCGMYQGYRRFMLGDDVCRREDSLRAAIGLFKKLEEAYGRMKGWKRFIL
jgi:pyruvate kinase